MESKMIWNGNMEWTQNYIYRQVYETIVAGCIVTRHYLCSMQHLNK